MKCELIIERKIQPELFFKYEGVGERTVWTEDKREALGFLIKDLRNTAYLKNKENKEWEKRNRMRSRYIN